MNFSGSRYKRTEERQFLAYPIAECKGPGGTSSDDELGSHLFIRWTLCAMYDVGLCSIC